MKVWTGRKAGLADKPNEFSLLDQTPRPNTRGDVRQVCIPTGKTARMLDANKVSISAIPTRKCDRSVRNCHNRTASRHGVVGGQMSAFLAQDRTHPAVVETGADAWRKFQRRRQDGALKGNALFVVIRILESEAAIMAASVDQFSRLNLPVLYERAIVQEFVNDQPDLITRPNLRAEIDLPLENLRKFSSQVLAPGNIGEGFPK